MARSPKDITIAQILKTTGDLPKLAPCLENNKTCPLKSKCYSIGGGWDKLNKMIIEYQEVLDISSILR